MSDCKKCSYKKLCKEIEIKDLSCDDIKRIAEQTEPQTDSISAFADILFDKDTQEQFLKECEAMGIMTDCSWK